MVDCRCRRRRLAADTLEPRGSLASIPPPAASLSTVSGRYPFRVFRMLTFSDLTSFARCSRLRRQTRPAHSSAGRISSFFLFSASGGYCSFSPRKAYFLSIFRLRCGGWFGAATRRKVAGIWRSVRTVCGPVSYRVTAQESEEQRGSGEEQPWKSKQEQTCRGSSMREEATHQCVAGPGNSRPDLQFRKRFLADAACACVLCLWRVSRDWPPAWAATRMQLSDGLWRDFHVFLCEFAGVSSAPSVSSVPRLEM
ncbi:unnamed protein product, partial [Scytosiphon promiscuus]